MGSYVELGIDFSLNSVMAEVAMVPPLITEMRRSASVFEPLTNAFVSNLSATVSARTITEHTAEDVFRTVFTPDVRACITGRHLTAEQRLERLRILRHDITEQLTSLIEPTIPLADLETERQRINDLSLSIFRRLSGSLTYADTVSRLHDVGLSTKERSAAWVSAMGSYTRLATILDDRCTATYQGLLPHIAGSMDQQGHVNYDTLSELIAQDSNTLTLAQLPTNPQLFIQEGCKRSAAQVQMVIRAESEIVQAVLACRTRERMQTRRTFLWDTAVGVTISALVGWGLLNDLTSENPWILRILGIPTSVFAAPPSPDNTCTTQFDGWSYLYRFSPQGEGEPFTMTGMERINLATPFAIVLPNGVEGWGMAVPDNTPRTKDRKPKKGRARVTKIIFNEDKAELEQLIADPNTDVLGGIRSIISRAIPRGRGSSRTTIFNLTEGRAPSCFAAPSTRRGMLRDFFNAMGREIRAGNGE